jgi:hypothetical protein
MFDRPLLTLGQRLGSLLAQLAPLTAFEEYPAKHHFQNSAAELVFDFGELALLGELENVTR